MDSKDLIEELSARSGYSPDDAVRLLDSLTSVMGELFQERKALEFGGFGVFRVEKRLERIISCSAGGQRFLVPPELCLTFETVTQDAKPVPAGFAALLVKRSPIPMDQADAESFIGIFSALVKEKLATDKYVKVKGLGAFKQLDAEGGQGYPRISFTPDAAMRELVNKPFSHFETVLLNDGVRFDDIAEEIVPSEELTKGKEREKEPDGTLFVPPGKPCQEMGWKSKFSHRSWFLTITVLLVGILTGGAIVWGVLSGRQYPSGTEAVQPTDLPPLPPLATSDTIAIQEDTSATLAMPLCDAVHYRIAGTCATHIIRRGESLALLAEKYYGNRRLWPYIARHNRGTIRNADNIPAGTAVHIPILVSEAE